MRLDHVLISSADYQAMRHFFISSIGLTQGYRPPFSFEGSWLYGTDNIALVHLVNAAGNKAQQRYLSAVNTKMQGRGVVDHIAIRSLGYQVFKNRLDQTGVIYFERSVPELLEHQVFIDGPEGLKIEMLFNSNEI
ncbi:hypothetical protein AMS58_09680 [Pseudoalteromonas porphyrae]|uniref:VOC domain-containing protein n=1 Tax=Pseudoalteromonas porphyrae TaxID=187330 RepID=A0A0N1MUM7_9GAMM|nr:MULTISPECIES: hypothetical protein [Pseudoalteromonas]KPH62214.1 hypothetical protein ADS77_13020 [Pseudoalteromonas porphyrae]KPH94780.1 hypothetical protein AMS58_09680 [Pseudoalteromonas porphyrae]